MHGQEKNVANDFCLDGFWLYLLIFFVHHQHKQTTRGKQVFFFCLFKITVCQTACSSMQTMRTRYRPVLASLQRHCASDHVYMQHYATNAVDKLQFTLGHSVKE